MSRDRRRRERRAGERGRRALVLTGACLSLLAVSPVSATAATPFENIASAGPLEQIYLGNELSCQVKLVGDVELSFFPPDTTPGDCGTFLYSGGTLYTPDFSNHSPAGTTATGSLPDPQAPFTPISQTTVTGSGGASDPFLVVTVVDAGTTGLRITQRDSYVVGNKFYLSEITVANSGAAAQPASLYHAGDCYLANTDIGFGFLEQSTGGVFCSETASNNPRARIIGFDPVGSESAGASFLETFFGTVWAEIDGTPFPNTCDCDLEQDNGAGLEWEISVPAGGQVTRSLITTVDPSGRAPPPEPAPVEACGFTIDGVNIQGLDAGETMTGTPLSDQLRGGGGKDLISGAEREDCLSGQADADKVRGNDGDDVIRGGAGSDTLIGGGGNDVIKAQNGNDKVKGGSGADKIKAQGRGSDKVNCGSGKDSVIGDVKDTLSANCERVKIVGGG